MKSESLNRFYQAFGRYLIWTVLIVGGLLLYLYQHVAVMDLAEELSSLGEEKKRLLDERDRLTVDVARLTHGKRVATIASEKLSMIIPSGAPRNAFTVSSSH
jgi:cell division protein FtsL